MTTRKTLLALAIAAAAVPALGQDHHTNYAPYTDATGMPWKATLSRSVVIDELRQAQAMGTVPVVQELGEAPLALKFTPPATGAPIAPDRTVLGGPRAFDPNLTHDGYVDVGGEAGHASPATMPTR